MAGIPAAVAAQIAAQVGRKGYSQASQMSVSLFDYDFINLGVKLIVYFAVAYAIAKYKEFEIWGTGIVASLARALGDPNKFLLQGGIVGEYLRGEKPAVSSTVNDFFTNGIAGFKYWDIVKAVAMMLVMYEGYSYYRSRVSLGLEPSPVTMAVFGLIETLLGMATVPELMERLKVLQTTVTERPRGDFTL